MSVAAVTIAGDATTSRSAPQVIRTIGRGFTAVGILVFAIGIALWRLATSWLGPHRKLITMRRAVLDPRHLHPIVSLIVIAAGVFTTIF